MAEAPQPPPTVTTSSRAAARPLVILAWANVALHALGLAAALGLMRPGSPLAPPAARRAWLATAPWGWSAGWAVWMLCALVLLALVTLIAERLRPAPLAALAAPLAAAACAVDLVHEMAQIHLLPRLAALGAEGEGLFAAVERTAQAAGNVVANGLYSLAVLALAIALRDRPGGRLGVAVFAAGMSIALADLLGQEMLLGAAVPATIVLFCAWGVRVARHCERHGGAPSEGGAAHR